MHGVSVAALIPIKAFRDAKGRLAPVLNDEQRAALARYTAEQVLGAASTLHPHVVCDDDEVADWALSRGAAVLREPHRGLNQAVDLAITRLTAAGFERVVVVHGDLPLPHSLSDVVALANPRGVTLVPDRRLDGTNVLAFPLRSGMRAAYGAGSFQRHLSAAMALGVPVSVIRDPYLAIDLDEPADLEHPLIAAAVLSVVGTVHPR
jgi:2-phospho-L-lactate guanylyltransferase